MEVLFNYKETLLFSTCEVCRKLYKVVLLLFYPDWDKETILNLVMSVWHPACLKSPLSVLILISVSEKTVISRKSGSISCFSKFLKTTYVYLQGLLDPGQTKPQSFTFILTKLFLCQTQPNLNHSVLDQKVLFLQQWFQQMMPPANSRSRALDQKIPLCVILEGNYKWWILLIIFADFSIRVVF